MTQHSGSHLASVVATPKYPHVTVAPVAQGTYAYGLPSLDESSRPEGSSQGHINDTVLDYANSGEDGGEFGIASASSSLVIEPRYQITTENRSSSSEPGLSPRWCDHCKVFKPDRCHHCSECNSCVLRMDHHCPWINGCIGFGNYKYFYLFIFYGSVSSLWVFTTMVPILAQVLSGYRSYGEPQKNSGDGGYLGTTTFGVPFALWSKLGAGTAVYILDVQWVAITVLTFLLTIVMVTFTGAHTSYILSNRTTIEALQDSRNTFIRVQYQKLDRLSARGNVCSLLRSDTMPSFMSQIEYDVVMVGKKERLWDRGSWIANWNAMMGPTWWLWFLPYQNLTGDGIHDVYNEKVYRRLVGDALAQARVQVVTFGLPVDSNRGEGGAGPIAAVLPPSRTEPEPFGSTSYSSGTDPISGETGRAPPGAKKYLNSNTSTEVNVVSAPTIHSRASSAMVLPVPVPKIQLDSVDDGPSQTTLQLRRDSSAVDPQQQDGSHLVVSAPTIQADEDTPLQDGGSSGYSTPKQASMRNHNSRQRSPKSHGASSHRRRQRAVSGGSIDSYGGPIPQFGMGLGMDGVPVDSGTGLKLSSGLRGWSNQGYGKSYHHTQQDRP
ncbi:palmitoyltransferase for Vac8p [Dissophora globulifera]|uniref:Palmitoyltransferase n=1 Tax=Dissophora globulifera TaxID=979702 RepID=A0A9P6RKW8_9FUNG|nr:palmitoyltransferase for Vac8p [Dissophora globulifera]